jgi:hypothetical protein
MEDGVAYQPQQFLLYILAFTFVQAVDKKNMRFAIFHGVGWLIQNSWGPIPEGLAWLKNELLQLRIHGKPHHRWIILHNFRNDVR